MRNYNQTYEGIMSDISFVTINVKRLNALLDDKCNKYCNYDNCNKNKVTWLNEWHVAVQNELLQRIVELIISNGINRPRLELLDETITSYYNYFEFIENDNDSNDDEKYEEIFNTIIQMPFEINMMLGI